jgi:hypothetical protein
MTEIEMQDVLARIKRAQAETDTFVEEGRKLRADTERSFDEARKLGAEAGKFERDRQLLPWQVFVTLLGAGAALFAAGAAFVKLIGG